MFKRIESQLKIQGKTKVWFAGILDESTQNINNWKKRGVPAAKVKKISQVLGVSREYLESGKHLEQQVTTTAAEYIVDITSKQINYTVFVDVKDQKVAILLRQHLQSKNDLNFLHCSSWSYDDPFVAVDIWQEEQAATHRVLLRQDCIVGITGYQSAAYFD